MTLLERFRSQPRHKHPDPSVRLAYVGEIPLDDRDAIGSIAREDDDPRVRRAAVAKLMEPALLGRIAREDADEGVRSTATAMLRDIALEAFEGIGELESVAAVSATVDGKSLVAIAKGALKDAVGLAALSRISDTHALGSIARHAALETVRRDAFDALQRGNARAEILAIALSSDHKDTALRAVDVLTEDDELEQIASRGRNKNAVKRARQILRERADLARQEADRAAEAERAAKAESAHLAASPRVAAEQPSDAAEEELRLARDREQAAEEERQQGERARRDAEAAEAERVEQDQRSARMTALASDAEAASGLESLASARDRFNAVRREWTQLAARAAGAEELTARFKEAERQLVAREDARREAEARARTEALARLQDLAGRAESMASNPALSQKAADRGVRDLRAALSAMPSVPTKKDQEEIGARLKAAQSALLGKVKELREAVEWKQWANVTVQEQLCEGMEALRSVEDPQVLAREIRDLQGRWRQAADVPREQADRLWRRFKAAHDELWARCQTYFSAVAEERAGNLARKTTLCEKAEALSNSTDWIRTADQIKQLQAEWKTIGQVPPGQEKAIWERFRSACDRFFTRRRDDLAQRKTLWAENLAKKEALCDKVAALADTTDWDGAAAEVRRIQNEWRTLGTVRKNRSEALWERFRTACDTFFARYADRHSVARAERARARESLCEEIEQLAPAASADQVSPDAAPPDLLKTVRSLRTRWQEERSVRGADPAAVRELEARFDAGLLRVLAAWPDAFRDSELDIEANRRRMQSLAHRMEELASSLDTASAAADPLLSPTSRLATMLKEALAANTIGGKVDDDSRLRAAAEEVHNAQHSWSRIGLVPETDRRTLNDRFQAACRRVLAKTTPARVRT